jgi:hypothetical protein
MAARDQLRHPIRHRTVVHLEYATEKHRNQGSDLPLQKDCLASRMEVYVETELAMQ